jgi:pimeloyl-ACP methyl ester carboxylesterase
MGEMMQRFSSNGIAIAYVDVEPLPKGRVEPIVLIHGFASTHAINWGQTSWVRTLSEAGRRVIALDNRGHGQSDKPYEPAAYGSATMAEDVRGLIDHLGLTRIDVMGYSMGARIAAFLTLAHPQRVRSAIFGGLGQHLVDGVGLPLKIAEAMEAPSLASLTDPRQRQFRAFAEQTGSDLRALAACIRGSRQTLTAAEVARIECPALVAVGSKDDIAGNPYALAAMMPQATALEIPNRDHQLAVGDKVYKQGALEFLAARP